MTVVLFFSLIQSWSWFSNLPFLFKCYNAFLPLKIKKVSRSFYKEEVKIITTLSQGYMTSPLWVIKTPVQWPLESLALSQSLIIIRRHNAKDGHLQLVNSDHLPAGLHVQQVHLLLNPEVRRMFSKLNSPKKSKLFPATAATSNFQFLLMCSGFHIGPSISSGTSWWQWQMAVLLRQMTTEPRTNSSAEEQESLGGVSLLLASPHKTGSASYLPPSPWQITY